MNKKRAQAWGYDLMAGMTIFVIGIFLFFLYSLNYNSGENSIMKELQYETLLVSDSLLSEGVYLDSGNLQNDYPTSWIVSTDMDDVQKIGLLSEGKINSVKLENFFDMSNPTYYGLAKRKFNIKNNYWVNFSEKIMIDGVLVSGIGSQPNSDAKNVIKSGRVVVYGDKIKSMNVYIWN